MDEDKKNPLKPQQPAPESGGQTIVPIPEKEMELHVEGKSEPVEPQLIYMAEASELHRKLEESTVQGTTGKNNEDQSRGKEADNVKGNPSKP